jgi:hypothetical protein
MSRVHVLPRGVGRGKTKHGGNHKLHRK